MTGILFDLDGVFYQGDQLITGADQVAAWLDTQRIPHLFLTNTSSRPVSELVKKLGNFGIRCSENQILTPAIACVNWLNEHLDRQKVALFLPESTLCDFRTVEVADKTDSDVAAVVIGDLGQAWDFNTLNRAFRLLMNNKDALLIALGMSRYWLAEDGLRLDVAPFVMALAHASGRTPIVMGKPAELFFEAALKIIGKPSGDCLMIGDDIRSDIGGAQAAGIRTMLVKTGKYREPDLQAGIKPDVILETVCDLPGWWEQQKSGS